MPKKNVGLIGCGTIGTHLALAIESRTIVNASLVGLFDVVDSNAKSLQSKLKSSPEVHPDFNSFIDSPADIIIEAASQEAIRKFGKPIIEASKDLMIMSVGALADATFLTELLDLAAVRKGRSKIYVPTGAIAGIDAIRSVKHLLDSITLTTTKSPKALAGVGADKTKVRVVVDPQATTNQHEIVAKGRFGDIKITVNNVTTPGNPKTSFLAVLSAIECLRSICNDALRVGS